MTEALRRSPAAGAHPSARTANSGRRRIPSQYALRFPRATGGPSPRGYHDTATGSAPAAAAPVLAVHDEIVVECPEADADPVKAWLTKAMVDAMAPLAAPVPVEVEAKIGRTWGGE